MQHMMTLCSWYPVETFNFENHSSGQSSDSLVHVIINTNYVALETNFNNML